MGPVEECWQLAVFGEGLKTRHAMSEPAHMQIKLESIANANAPVDNGQLDRIPFKLQWFVTKISSVFLK